MIWDEVMQFERTYNVFFFVT